MQPRAHSTGLESSSFFPLHAHFDPGRQRSQRDVSYSPRGLALHHAFYTLRLLNSQSRLGTPAIASRDGRRTAQVPAHAHREPFGLQERAEAGEPRSSGKEAGSLTTPKLGLVDTDAKKGRGAATRSRTPLILTLEAEADLFEFEANLVYTSSSMLAKAT